MLLASAASALWSGRKAARQRPPADRLRFGLTVALLHFLQPAARFAGRLRQGLTPLRRRGVSGWAFPWPTTLAYWSETWRSLEERIGAVEQALQQRGAAVRRGGEFDDWDLELRAGPLAGARTRATLEEHGGGKQMVRLRAWPTFSRRGTVLGGDSRSDRPDRDGLQTGAARHRGRRRRDARLSAGRRGKCRRRWRR